MSEVLLNVEGMSEVILEAVSLLQDSLWENCTTQDLMEAFKNGTINKEALAKACYVHVDGWIEDLTEHFNE